MSLLRFFIGTLVFIALLLLALSNTEPVTLRFFQIASHQSPLAFVVLVAFAIGVATGLTAGVARSARLRRQIARLRRDVRPGPRTPGPHGAQPGAHPQALKPPRDAV